MARTKSNPIAKKAYKVSDDSKKGIVLRNSDANDANSKICNKSVTADDLLGMNGGANAVSLSAGEDEEKLLKLVAFAKALEKSSAYLVQKFRLDKKSCVKCSKKVKIENNCFGCKKGFCKDCTTLCINGCDKCICDDCGRICDFDDELGGKGCGKLVCNNCYTSTKCDRNDVGGCEECLGEFDCVECDHCRYC
jgi:hypothetical protein